MDYQNGGRGIGGSVIGTAAPQGPNFQLVPHMLERTGELAKIAGATGDILLRLRGSQPQPATDKIAKAPESATDFGYAQAELVRIIAQNVQEISALIG